MKNKNLIQIMFEKLKSIFTQSNGILLNHKVQLPEEISSYQAEVFSDLKMKNQSEDRKNLRIDANNLKSDMKIAVAKHKNEYCY